MMQVPQRLYTLDELRLNGIEASSLLSPVDTTLGSIERNLQLAAVLGGLSAWNVLGFSPQQVLYFSLGLLFLWTLDSVIPLSLLSLSLSLSPHAMSVFCLNSKIMLCYSWKYLNFIL
jgi:hypothetical protein